MQSSKPKLNCSSLFKQIKKLQTAVDKEASKERECIQESQKAEERAENLRNTITTLTATKAEEDAKLDEIMVSLQEGTAELRKQVEIKQEELIEVQRSVAEFQTEKEGLTTSLELTQRRSVNAAKALSAAQARISDVEKVHRSTIDKRDQGLATIKECEDALKQLETEMTKLTLREDDLQKKLRTAITNAEEAKASMQASSGRSTTLSSILKAAKKGGPLARAGEFYIIITFDYTFH